LSWCYCSAVADLFRTLIQRDQMSSVEWSATEH
jgi:hypothetical protein